MSFGPYTELWSPWIVEEEPALELSISLDGRDAAAKAGELRIWLQEKRLRDVSRLEQVRGPPGPGEQGPELVPLLTVVLAAPAVIELVRSIHRWIEATRPAVTITVKDGDRTITIHAQNPGSVAEVAAEAERLSKG